MGDPQDNDYWTWREENERVIQAQAEEEQWYGEYRETCEKRDALDAAFTAAGVLPVATTRRIRLTEAF